MPSGVPFPKELRVELSKQYARARIKRYRLTGLCVRCSAWHDTGKKCCPECSHKNKIVDSARYQGMLQQVRKAYGDKCVCCGESEKSFLAIDHIHGGGRKLRQSGLHQPCGYGFYKWLIENKFPKEFQLLCYNCNWSKHVNGICVHNIKHEN